jgi:hypothetical protein
MIFFVRGHEAAVLCVQFDSEKIISGSCDRSIKVGRKFSLMILIINRSLKSVNLDLAHERFSKRNLF